VAALDVLHQTAHGLGVAGPPEGGRTLERRLGARAKRDEKGVPTELQPAGGAHGVRVGVHRLEPVDDALGADVAGDRVERVAAGDRERERVGDTERPVRQLVLGCEERDVDAVAREIAQRERCFQASGAGTGD
jgi:hypothetical protein